MDADGSWWVFEVEPQQNHRGWYENELGRYQKLDLQDAELRTRHDWRDSLAQVTPDKFKTNE